VPAIRPCATRKAAVIGSADRLQLVRPLISELAYGSPIHRRMITLADQCRFAAADRENAPARARAYCIGSQILPNCHKLKYCHLVAHSSARKLPARVCCYQDGLRLASQTTGRSLRHSAPIEFAAVRWERFATARPRRLASQTIGEGKRSELARQGKRYKRPRQGRSGELARLSLHLLRSPQVSVTKASLI
jgi:hypothetical protein